MSITDKDIESWENKWGVDIEKQPDGSYTVTSNETHVKGTEGSGLDTQYKINVRPLEEDITINPDYAKHEGVELTGDNATDWANLNRASFEGAPGADDFESNYPRFNMSHLHRGSCVAACLRSNGEIPPASWHANPAFGASGAGAKIEFQGGQGGKFSTIGPAHDTDFTLGSVASVGPMKAAGEYFSATGKLAHGMNGIRHVADLGGQFAAPAEYEIYQKQLEEFPKLRDIPVYDRKDIDKPGWNVEMIKHYGRERAQIDVEAENNPNDLDQVLANVGGADPNEATFGGHTSQAGTDALQTGESVAMLGGIGAQIGNVLRESGIHGTDGIGEKLGEALHNGGSEAQPNPFKGLHNVLNKVNGAFREGGAEVQAEHATELPSQEALLNTLEASPITSGAIGSITKVLGNLNDVLRDGGGEAQAIHEQVHAIGGPPEGEAGIYELSIDDAKLVLQQAREALNSSGVDSQLRDVLNHPGADDMLDTLKTSNLDPLIVHGEQGVSPVEQIQSVLEAGRDTMIDNGLEMPTVQPEAEIPSADVIQEYGAADDEYDYGLG